MALFLISVAFWIFGLSAVTWFFTVIFQHYVKIARQKRLVREAARRAAAELRARRAAVAEELAAIDPLNILVLVRAEVRGSGEVDRVLTIKHLGLQRYDDDFTAITHLNGTCQFTKRHRSVDLKKVHALADADTGELIDDIQDFLWSKVSRDRALARIPAQQRLTMSADALRALADATITTPTDEENATIEQAPDDPEKIKPRTFLRRLLFWLVWLPGGIFLALIAIAVVLGLSGALDSPTSH